MNLNFDSFSHGQIISKIWLCENLEPYILKNARIAILGSWYNILSFMMITRQPYKYQHILGIDVNPETIDIADKICSTWTMGINAVVENKIGDAGNVDFSEFDVVINCSPEHMPNDWYNNVKEGTLVCIQTSDVTDSAYPWLVSNPNKDIDTMIEKYPLSQRFFMGTKEIEYTDWGYKRFMTIGLK
jgi:SAM-dependent methyltransferase